MHRLLALLLVAAATQDGADWKPLFNGKDLDNWVQTGTAK
jgi:hypothetical protein